MNTVLHKASTRGHANHGWLDSHHTFSFAGYYNPERVNFGALRVLNDDIVKGGAGFGQHPHDNMEIISIPLTGSLEHGDDTGGRGIIKSGEVQIMSAGSGLAHSERNASRTEDVNFLQIWVFPKERNITPRYDQKFFDSAQRKNKFQTVVSPDKGDDSLWINQDAWFSLGSLSKQAVVEYSLKKPGNGVYAFIIQGDVTIDGITLNRRDGLGIWESEKISMVAASDAEVLLMEVPMEQG
ncbi:MAG: pirin family protein [Cyclobacteriaceae bacterium]|nr:pirin family protein [Cyclobacteriaceae bacterium]MDH4295765.1 pirin family protein [Cyclobacteriaceae bacterium]MDH5250911.1 pirin family protein [Cyclobacteriaceae bacterium]